MKNKVILRISLLLLLCAMCFPMLVSCSKGTEEIPDGMQLATCHNADFRLFVPTHWNVNTSYGISGAYYNLVKQSTVSVMRYEITEAMKTELEALTKENAKADARLKWFFEKHLKPQVVSIASTGVTMNEDECIATQLDGVNAWQFRYSSNVNGDELEFLQIVCERKNGFYVFALTATRELYELFSQDITNMLTHFKFTEEPYAAPYLKDLDENADAPEGMKLASNTDVSYLFYVPKTWQVSRDEEIFAAYYEADRSSVSVVPYMPTAEGMSIVGFFEKSEEMMKKTAGGNYQLHDSKEVQVAGKNAMQYEYSYCVGTVTCRYRQIITAHQGMIYSITYTAAEENFEAHLDDLNAIVTAFAFR